MTVNAVLSDKWNEYMDKFPVEKKDIYFTEQYAKLYETNSDKARCYIYEDSGNYFLFPFLTRKIDSTYSDFESPYGYGGPICSTDEKTFTDKAVNAFDHLMKENKYVAGFARMHPIFGNYLILQEKYKVIFDRQTVFMDLSGGEQGIWKSIHSKHRNSINKAKKTGLEFIVDEKMERMSDFRTLYNRTMEKIGADKYYYFTDKYFDDLSKLSENVFIGTVIQNNEIISAAVFFRYGMYGHYHLAGTDDKAAEFNPNSFLIYSAALYLHDKGAKILHLGGGTDSSPDNGLYRFKKRFSKNECKHYICKMIFDEGGYKEMCSIWEKNNRDKLEKYGKLHLKYRY